MSYALHSQRICLPDGEFQPGVVVIGDNGKIAYIGSEAGVEDHDLQHINLGDHYLVAGFIDIHTHGGYGVSFGNEPLEEGLRKYSQWVVRFGVCGFVISLTAPDKEDLLTMIRKYVKILGSQPEWPGAVPLGLHLEGPFLNPQKAGAFNPAWIRPPNTEEVQSIIAVGGGWIKHVTLAPELEGANLIAELFTQSGVTVSLGHSNAEYEIASTALAGYFSHVTHTFNAQSPMHHRAPGVVGAVLSSDKVTAELIGDPHHVHSAAMKVLYRCLGSERVVLVSDAMPGAGLPDGEYELVGQKVRVKNGASMLADGSLAGSVITMDACLRTLVQQADIPVEHALRMASLNPAKVIGKSNVMGSLEVGKEANLAVLDENLAVVKTWVKGKTVFIEKGIH